MGKTSGVTGAQGKRVVSRVSDKTKTRPENYKGTRFRFHVLSQVNRRRLPIHCSAARFRVAFRANVAVIKCVASYSVKYYTRKIVVCQCFFKMLTSITNKHAAVMTHNIRPLIQITYSSKISTSYFIVNVVSTSTTPPTQRRGTSLPVNVEPAVKLS